MAPVLSEEQVAQYHQLGYATVEGVFTPEQTRELQAVTDHFIELSRQDSYEAQCLRYAGDAGRGGTARDCEVGDGAGGARA